MDFSKVFGDDPEPYVVIVLDRAIPDQHPGHRVYGQTLCAHCEKACWLGDKTMAQVKAGSIPCCTVCMDELEAAGLLPDGPAGPKAVDTL